MSTSRLSYKPLAVAHLPGKPGPGKSAPLGTTSWIVNPSAAKSISVLDATLSITATLKAPPFGQIAGSPDGKLVAVSAIGDVRLLGLDGKKVASLDTVEWWENTSGGVAFTGDGRRLWFSCVPDEDELDARAAVGVLDVKSKKRLALAPLEGFDHEAHLTLHPCPDGRSAVLWANAGQDAQRYFHVTGDGEDLAVAPIPGPSEQDASFLGWITEASEILALDHQTVGWYSILTGECVRTLSLEGAVTEDDIVIAAAPLADQALLVFAYGFRTREGRLLRVSGDGAVGVDIEGITAGQVNGICRGGDKLLVTHADGSVALLAPGITTTTT